MVLNSLNAIPVTPKRDRLLILYPKFRDRPPSKSPTSRRTKFQPRQVISEVGDLERSRKQSYWNVVTYNQEKSTPNGMSLDRLEFPLAKAEYLFNHATVPREGGDKQKFWRTVMGFESPEVIREAILATVTIDRLKPREATNYGEKYQATVLIEGASSVAWRIKTVWIVLTGEDVARFVTAVPERFGRQQ
jgi:hypothetical protein